MAGNNFNSGALFINDRKQSERQPDYTGSINVNGVEYFISGWRKKSRQGTNFLSLAVNPKQGQPAQPQHDEFEGGYQQF